MYIKCSCQFCGEHIEFDSAYVGKLIKCPHCYEFTMLSPPKVPFITDATLETTDIPLPEITIKYDFTSPDKKTDIIIENRGNMPSVRIFGLKVEIDGQNKILYIQKIGELKWEDNTRRNRVNYTRFKIFDGIYLYYRPIKKNYRELDSKVFKIQDGNLSLVYEDDWQWDCKQRIEQYYSEYSDKFVFRYIDEDVKWSGSFDDRIRSRYS